MAASIEIVIKWSGKEYNIPISNQSETVSHLKKEVHKLTGVLPERQKLLGLKYKGMS